MIIPVIPIPSSHVRGSAGFSPQLLVRTCRILLKILRVSSSGKQRCGSGNTPHKWCQHTLVVLGFDQTWLNPSLSPWPNEGLQYYSAIQKVSDQRNLVLKKRRNLAHNNVPKKQDYRACVKIAESYLVEIHFSSYTNTVLLFRILNYCSCFLFCSKFFCLFTGVLKNNLLEPNQRSSQWESVKYRLMS